MLHLQVGEEVEGGAAQVAQQEDRQNARLQLSRIRHECAVLHYCSCTYEGEKGVSMSRQHIKTETERELY